MRASLASDPQGNVFVSHPRAVSKVDRWLLAMIRSRFVGVPTAFALWDGRAEGLGPETIATIQVHDRTTLAALCWDPELAFGEGYARGSITVEGDLVGLLDRIYRVYLGHARTPPRERMRWAPSNTTARSRSNVHEHYDIGNAFYRLWLDPKMLYTCAYYAHAEDTLEHAQVAKLDYVCRKLRLRAGEHVIEAGSGWGALSLHVAKHYGVRVTAYNVSAEQVRFARSRARTEGLEHLVEFVEEDYRAARGPCDVFVSLGMLEHVGRSRLGEFGAVVSRVLSKPDGRGLIHFIGRNYPTPLSRWIRARVFPGAYSPALAEVVGEVLAPFDLSVVDVENLRHHYARTLADWSHRFTAAEHEVARMYGDRFVRTWRLYLAGSEAGFRSGSMQLFQIVFARGESRQPWPTRDGLYATPLASECP